jgi:sarcosine/dimethylglycine N-methyltransferase
MRSHGPEVNAAEVLAANHREYDRGVDPLLVLAVYRPVHDGWYFTNIGGRTVLDFVGERALLGPGRRALELCSGLGDTCRYLAQRFGCDVTGIELNRAQLDAARERLAEDPELAARIDYVEGDVLTWTPPLPYHAVYAIDSVMMIPDVRAVLASAWRALAPGGRLVLAEIAGGPFIDEAARQYAWEEGAIISLPGADEYRATLSASGFVDIEIEDLTAQAVEFFASVRAATEARRSEMVAIGGIEAHDKWLSMADAYATHFRAGRYQYLRATAVRP